MVEERRKRISLIDSILSRFPEDVLEHLTNSQKEILKAVDKLINRMIEKMDERIARVRDIREKRKG